MATTTSYRILRELGRQEDGSGGNEDLEWKLRKMELEASKREFEMGTNSIEFIQNSEGIHGVEVKTFENETFTTTYTTKGWIVWSSTSSTSSSSSSSSTTSSSSSQPVIFETFQAILSSKSPGYREWFAGSLLGKLQALAESQRQQEEKEKENQEKGEESEN